MPHRTYRARLNFQDVQIRAALASANRTQRSRRTAAVLSRVLEEFANLPFQSERGERFFVSFSAGVASFPADGANVDALIRAADRRLYKAKHTGRAHVVVGDAVAS